MLRQHGRRRPGRWLPCLLAGLLLPLCAGGCAGKKTAVPVAVKGRVQYADRKPVANMVLLFHPQDDSSRGGRPPQFVLAKDGRFQGEAAAGRYKATLAAIQLGAGGSSADAGSLAPPGKEAGGAGMSPLFRYQDPTRSPWEFDIPEGGKEDLVLIVK